MNPTLPADYLQRMEQDDPEAYRSEVLGEFRAGISSLFDPEALEVCVIPNRRELPPIGEVLYAAFCDPSGGRADAFTLAIGHRASDRAVVDCLRAWKPPFNLSAVIEEAAGLVKAYRINEVTGDKYGGEFPREAFRSHGVTYKVADAAKSDLYLALLPAVNADRVELPDIPELLRELRGLERRRGSSGRDHVDHPAGGGHHDDRANSIAGLVHVLFASQPVWVEMWGGDIPARPQTEEEQQEEDRLRRERAEQVVLDEIRRFGAYGFH